MGEYTELNISVQLKTLPEDSNVMQILKFMLGGSDLKLEDLRLPNHPLFKTRRWKSMLYCDSFYFHHTACSSLVNKTAGIRHLEDATYILNVRCDLKNYDDEILYFLNWLLPFTETRGFVGYKRGEDADPVLIYFTNDYGVEYKPCFI